MTQRRSIPNIPATSAKEGRAPFDLAVRDAVQWLLDQLLNGIDAPSATAEHADFRRMLVDLLEFSDSGQTVGVRQLAWNRSDDTMDIGHSDGVTQQVGLELYGRIFNGTGAPLGNGKAIGFASTVNGSGSLAGQHYIANGTMPALYIIGISTQDIQNNSKGRVTVWGHVRGLNTTGAPYGETWVKDQILYASPTVAGGLTNVKPTAPNECVPIAAVLYAHATEGVIFVRPTVQMHNHYGVFSDTTNKTAAAAYTPYAVTFNTTDYANGFARGTPTSRIVADESGLYNFQFSAQIISASASAKKIWIWPRINGVDVPNSNSEVTISGSNQVLIPAWNWALSMAKNDYFELMFAVDDINLSMAAVAAQTGANGTPTFARPAVPSIILTVTQAAQ